MSATVVGTTQTLVTPLLPAWPSRTHARRRGGEALKRLQTGEWPAPSTVIDLYGSWAAAVDDAFGGAWTSGRHCRRHADARLRSAVCQQDRCTTVTAPGMAIGATMKQPRTTATTRGPVTLIGATGACWPLWNPNV